MSPAIGGNHIVFGASDGHVRCIDIETGEVLWPYNAAAPVRATPLIVRDRVYVGSDYGRLSALSLGDGEVLWLYPPAEVKELALAISRNDKPVNYVRIESDYGHDAFLIETDKVSQLLRAFL